MLSPADIATMQAIAQEIFDTTCTITRDGSTTDTWASPGSGTPSQIGGTISCQLGRPNPQTLAQYASKILGRVSYMVSLPVGTDVLAGDIITIGTRTLEVQAKTDLESYQILLRVLAVEVR